jgi:hypothetical protein
MPSFNVLIATVGRPSLQRMLDSLSPQLEEQDCLTLVFDGKSEIPKFNLSGFKCKVNQYCEPAALGFWGHGIRNKYASLLDKTDFVMHADDDDSYLPNVFSELRSKCIDNDSLYIAKMKIGNRIVPEGNFIKINHIGTPNGIIPYKFNMLSKWESFVGGDGKFYELLSSLVSKVEYLDLLMYQVRS